VPTDASLHVRGQNSAAWVMVLLYAVCSDTSVEEGTWGVSSFHVPPLYGGLEAGATLKTQRRGLKSLQSLETQVS
jgi:hypothetical protein